MIYRRVVNNIIDGTFIANNGKVLVGNIYYSQVFLNRNRGHEGLYPQVEVVYAPSAEIVSDWYLDATMDIVTKKIYPFTKGIQHNWKAQEHVNDQLYRKIRIRVVRSDTFAGGSLDSLADKALKTTAPRYDVDSSGNLNAEGGFVEIYLVTLDPADEAALQVYVDATAGAVLEKFDELP